MRLFSLFAFVLALGLLAPPTLSAAQTPCQPVPAGRPCVGLVLAGGGAKGLAHIGVLRVLEELRVPIDVIGGTSMGAIIGGLYAQGVSADELQREIDSIDWRGILRDRPPREALAFRRKQDDQNFLVKYSLGISRQGVRLPRAIIHGRKLDAKLRALTLPSAHRQDFDRLPRPFRCVAADLETGEAVVLRGGDLARALRASMAIPGVFPPIEIEGRTLIDGGIANNTPVDVVREELGAEVLIVVDLRKSVQAEDIQSAGQVFDQMLNIMVIRNTNERLAMVQERDIVIHPDIVGIATGDFLKAPEAIKRGLVAARAQAPALQALALTPEAYAAHRTGQLPGRGAGPPRAAEADEAPIIDEVVIEAQTRVSREVIASRMRTKAGERLDQAKLQQDLADINGLDIFERVDAALKEQAGRQLLVVTVEEKAWGPHYLKFGINLEDDFRGGDSYNLAFQHVTNPVNRLAGELRNEVQIGHQQRLFSEFYQPLDYRGRYFIAPQIEYTHATADVFEGNQRTAEVRVERLRSGVDLGRTLGIWGELRGGFRYLIDSDVDVRIGATALGETRLSEGGYFGRVAYDTLDNPNFPHHGAFAESLLGVIREEMGSAANFQALLTSGGIARTWGRQTLLVMGDFATLLDDDDEAVGALFPLGGLLQISGLERGRLSGQHRALGRAVTYYRVTKGQRMMQIPVYVGGSYELGAVEDDLGDFSWDRALNAGSLFVGFDTPLGPLYLAYGFAEGGEDSPYLFVGRTF